MFTREGQSLATPEEMGIVGDNFRLAGTMNTEARSVIGPQWSINDGDETCPWRETRVQHRTHFRSLRRFYCLKLIVCSLTDGTAEHQYTNRYKLLHTSVRSLLPCWTRHSDDFKTFRTTQYRIYRSYRFLRASVIFSIGCSMRRGMPLMESRSRMIENF